MLIIISYQGNEKPQWDASIHLYEKVVKTRQNPDITSSSVLVGMQDPFWKEVWQFLINLVLRKFLNLLYSVTQQIASRCEKCGHLETHIEWLQWLDSWFPKAENPDVTQLVRESTTSLERYSAVKRKKWCDCISLCTTLSEKDPDSKATTVRPHLCDIPEK